MEKYKMTKRTTSLLFKALVDVKDGRLLKAVRGNSRRAHFRQVPSFFHPRCLYMVLLTLPLIDLSFFF